MYSPNLFDLVQLGVLASDLLEVVASLTDIYSKIDTCSRGSRSPVIDRAVIPIYAKLCGLIFSGTPLSDFEAQLSYGLVATCVVFCSHYGLDASARCLNTPVDCVGGVFDAVAEAFLYRRFASSSLSTSHKKCLRSIALGLGASCFLPLNGASPELRMKGHIIIYSLNHNLPQSSAKEAPLTFATLVEEGREPFWEGLAAWTDFAQQAYAATGTRQREWEKLGLFNLGMPRGDRVEYMVLSSLRGKRPPLVAQAKLLAGVRSLKASHTA